MTSDRRQFSAHKYHSNKFMFWNSFLGRYFAVDVRKVYTVMQVQRSSCEIIPLLRKFSGFVADIM